MQVCYLDDPDRVRNSDHDSQGMDCDKVLVVNPCRKNDTGIVPKYYGFYLALTLILSRNLESVVP